MGRKKPASRHDWKTKPPSLMESFPYHRTFSAEQREKLDWGVVPLEMEDKWFAFVEDDILYWYRSWTASLIYEVRLESRGEEWVTSTASVCSDPALYERGFDQYEAEMLDRLIDHLLAGLLP